MNRNKELLTRLIERLGQRYSDILGIDLESGDAHEVFKWFLASILFGAPITEKSVIKTYRCFEKYGVLSPQRILETGWDGIVDILDEGGYTRYDFKTATKLLEVMNKLLDRYGGNLNAVHKQAMNSRDLEERLKGLGKGIGSVTVSIFLRELRDIWKKADPKPTPLVVMAAKNLSITKQMDPEKVLEDLKQFWETHKVDGKTFTHFETALLRLGKDFCRRQRCKICAFHSFCSIAALRSF